MKIAVSTRFLIQGKLEGIGRFTFEIFQRIAQQHPEHQFYFLFDRKPDSSFIFSANVQPIVLYPPARHPLLWYWWYEVAVKRALDKIQADLFIAPDGFASLASPIPTLLVIHDLAFLHYPKMVSSSASIFYRYFTPKYCRHARQIIAVSRFTQKDIVEKYGIDIKKIQVVGNGVHAVFKPMPAAEKTKFKNQYTHGADYFIYVGSLHPRKNITGLLAAFEKCKAKIHKPCKLVIAGARGWMLKDLDAQIYQSPFKEDIIFTGHLENHELANWLSVAEALVYVSFFEGFGIPIAEAMACGVPVITSKSSSMPEVAGDAALIVNPYNIDEIAEAMLQLFGNKDLQNQCVQKGLKQVQQFNWNLSAEKFWAVAQLLLPQ